MSDSMPEGFQVTTACLTKLCSTLSVIQKRCFSLMFPHDHPHEVDSDSPMSVQNNHIAQENMTQTMHDARCSHLTILNRFMKLGKDTTCVAPKVYQRHHI